MVREESLDRKTLDVRRHQAGGVDMIEHASSDGRGAPSCSMSETVAEDILKERQSIMVRGDGYIT